MKLWLERYRGPLTLALVAILLISAGVWFIRRPTPVAIEIATPTKGPLSKEIKVYVTGAVKEPGVYVLRENERIEDALIAAGGVTEEADLAKINLAAKLRDELHIHVPKVAETSPSASAGAGAAALLDINTATAAELDTLPGIGPVTSQRIVGYRQQHGPFKSIDDLRSAKLVNEATFTKIKDLITVR
ncbi:MAG: ComEA family DNA-binding protein [Chloroflexi bacterium]|nr:ComEA family DNA-binding protein [Chloroflexota bacterium]